MIHFEKDSKNLLLVYTSNRPPWVKEKLEREGSVSLKKGVFTFQKNARLEADDTEDEEEVSKFILGTLQGDGYYKIGANVLKTAHPVFVHKDFELKEETFVAIFRNSVFKELYKIVKEPIYLGGLNNNAISAETFTQILKNFPTAYELEKYALARISTVVRDRFENARDTVRSYDKYMNNRVSARGAGLLSRYKEYELEKFSTVLDRLKHMLKNESDFSEKKWQVEILEIIRLLYPKYFFVFKDVTISVAESASRFLDFMLLDANGHVDIVEIKKPHGIKIMSETEYRKNHIPLRELSGAVMQIEKYIYYLNRWGDKGETHLQIKYGKELPHGFKVKITNPSGIIIMGRDDTLTAAQISDFEVVKRKYKNIVDIITYDDLIRRLEYVIIQLRESSRKTSIT